MAPHMNIQSVILAKGGIDPKKPKESIKDVCPVNDTVPMKRAKFCIPVFETPAKIFGLSGPLLQASLVLINPNRVGERGDYSGFQTLQV